MSAEPPLDDDADAPAEVESWFTFTLDLIHSRHNVLPKRLAAPGPSAEQLRTLYALAAAAPDHGELTPWRFVVIPPAQRHRLGEVFAQALRDRDPEAGTDQFDAARDKAHRAPFSMIAIARLGPDEPDTPAHERLVSLGAALQNILLGAHAMGFGAGLTSGQAMRSPRLHALLGLADTEQAICTVNIGTAIERKPRRRARPLPDQFVSDLRDPV